MDPNDIDILKREFRERPVRQFQMAAIITAAIAIIGGFNSWIVVVLLSAAGAVSARELVLIHIEARREGWPPFWWL